jgi:glycerol kinase
MTLTEAPVCSVAGLSTTIAWQRGDRTSYALEGNISVSAQAAAWLAGLLGLVDVDTLTKLAATVPDSGGVYFVPALVGLGAPYWSDRARAVVSGMSLGTTPAHVARAALEAIALQIRDVFVAMETDLGAPLDLLSVDGGATRNDLLMQIQSDILAKRVRRRRIAELSAAGIGTLAATASGFWDEARAHVFLSEPDDDFSPKLDETARAVKVREWAEAVRAAIVATSPSLS